MTKNSYIHAIEKAAYTANMADTDKAEPWQKVAHASTHCQVLMELVRDIITPNAYQFWMDSFGEFSDIEAFEDAEAFDEANSEPMSHYNITG